jgi:hypothetical protein
MADQLVKMQQGQVIIEVHLTTVAAHQAVGWVVVTETEAEPAEVEAPVSAESKPVRRKSPKNS